MSPSKMVSLCKQTKSPSQGHENRRRQLETRVTDELMTDTVKIRGPTMLRRGSRTASSAKRKTHSCTEVAATQVAEG